MNSMDNAEHLSDFPNLVELAIHLESMPRAVGLSRMWQLQRLCMTETGLKSLKGIEACTSLTHLDCSHNKLTEIDGAVLRHLPKIRTMWLNDNAISRMGGLESLSCLTSLWLGSNRIPAVGDALTNNHALEDLNLAGNLVCNFKDIPTLARMRSLRTLAFGEPHFGDNPVCSLCNYQTCAPARVVALRWHAACVMPRASRCSLRMPRLPMTNDSIFFTGRLNF